MIHQNLKNGKSQNKSPGDVGVHAVKAVVHKKFLKTKNHKNFYPFVQYHIHFVTYNY